MPYASHACGLEGVDITANRLGVAFANRLVHFYPTQRQHTPSQARASDALHVYRLNTGDRYRPNSSCRSDGLGRVANTPTASRTGSGAYVTTSHDHRVNFTEICKRWHEPVSNG